MSENGREALAERLDEIFRAWAGKTNRDTADEILANGAVFLPDGAEIEGLRAIEAAARVFERTFSSFPVPALDALRAALAAVLVSTEPSAEP